MGSMLREKIDWKQIIKLIKEMPWRNMCKSGKAIEVIEYLLEKLYEICIEIVPKRIKMLKRDKHRAYSKKKKKQIDNKTCETEKQLIQTRQNPKMLYSIKNNQK